eukprot:9291877-Pyramimonas_sp.AAC.1
MARKPPNPPDSEEERVPMPLLVLESSRHHDDSPRGLGQCAPWERVRAQRYRYLSAPPGQGDEGRWSAESDGAGRGG